MVQHLDDKVKAQAKHAGSTLQQYDSPELIDLKREARMEAHIRKAVKGTKIENNDSQIKALAASGTLLTAEPYYQALEKNYFAYHPSALHQQHSYYLHADEDHTGSKINAKAIAYVHKRLTAHETPTQYHQLVMDAVSATAPAIQRKLQHVEVHEAPTSTTVLAAARDTSGKSNNR